MEIKIIYGCCTSKITKNCHDPPDETHGEEKALNQHKKLSAARVGFGFLPIEGLRAKRAYIAFLADFHFLQDRANFWQTDLF